MMARRLIVSGLFLAAITLSTSAWAQVGGGIKVGVNFARLSGLNDVSTTQRRGLMVGGFVTMGLAPLVAFEPEVLFSMQGSTLHFGASGAIVSSDVSAKLDYVQVPLLLRLGNSGKAGASLYGIVGPTIGFLARHEGVDEDLKNTDLGLVAGAGVTLSRLLLEGRYTYGLTDFNRGGATYRNRVASLLIGLNF